MLLINLASFVSECLAPRLIVAYISLINRALVISYVLWSFGSTWYYLLLEGMNFDSVTEIQTFIEI